MNRYLIDTSIWVKFFRGRSQVIKDRIFQLLAENRVVINGVVVSELLLGARGKKEVEFVKEKLLNLDYFEADKEFFTYCGTVGNKIRKAGINMPLSDIMIVTHAKMNDCVIFTMDKHFEAIGQIVEVQYDIIENF